MCRFSFYVMEMCGEGELRKFSEKTGKFEKFGIYVQKKTGIQGDPQTLRENRGGKFCR